LFARFVQAGRNAGQWDGPGIMRWGDHHIALNEWNELLAA